MTFKFEGCVVEEEENKHIQKVEIYNQEQYWV